MLLKRIEKTKSDLSISEPKPESDAPIWLQEQVYTPKRQRTIDLVHQSVDALRRDKQRISLTTVVSKSKELDVKHRGVSESAILDNPDARSYYEQYRSWRGTPRKRTKSPIVTPSASPGVVKPGRDEQRVHQRYLRMSKEALVERLIAVERTLAEQRERWLLQQDEALTWRLRAEANATLVEANLLGANLNSANLYSANLSEANLTSADLTGTKLVAANLYDANLWRANLNSANLSRANLVAVKLMGANMIGTKLHGADLSRADLSFANLHRAVFYGTHLSNANFNGADLTSANLSRAILVETNLTGANLTNCSVYGIAAWNVQLDGVIQENLVITPENEPTITVDNLKIAQFIYLLLNNKEIRDVIDTITSKVVLILGRFTLERKSVLDALREALRRQNYLPILFDFEKPSSRDLTETVITLAHLARFIIVDLTDPSSAPHEVATVIPQTVVPVQPLLLQEPLVVDGNVVQRREYAMFEDLRRRYHWVLPTFCYRDTDELLASLLEQIIAPAEQKAKELIQPR
jgi:uncharacterized protein YjbI with pentapeptide repeats